MLLVDLSRHPAPGETNPMTERLRAEYEALRTWLCDQALPLWSTRGLDRESGGFVERLSPVGEPGLEAHRARVVGCQLFTFALSPRLGWSGPAAEVVRYGRTFLDRYFWGGDGMVQSVVDRSGKVVRTDFDLYDHAFVLFGMAAASTIHADSEYLTDKARELAGRMKTHQGIPAAASRRATPGRCRFAPIRICICSKPR